MVVPLIGRSDCQPAVFSGVRYPTFCSPSGELPKSNHGGPVVRDSGVRSLWCRFPDSVSFSGHYVTLLTHQFSSKSAAVGLVRIV
jgi:hypothetical protein